jgi:hypothetical protein
MTEATARTVANVIVGSAALAAAYVIATTPPLRRLAVIGATAWLGGSVPRYLIGETRRAWSESGAARARTSGRSGDAGRILPGPHAFWPEVGR